jgi:hypothetical protein
MTTKQLPSQIHKIVIGSYYVKEDKQLLRVVDITSDLILMEDALTDKLAWYDLDVIVIMKKVQPSE